jgi:hemerythrin-like domain-containing protein
MFAAHLGGVRLGYEAGMTIATTYADHHRHCDEAFAQAEAEAQEGDWEAARGAFERFTQALTTHLSSEEQTLFPAFEAATGMTAGPTAVMRLEHAQMRQLLGELTHALAAKDADGFGGAAETLLVLMQQHNLKEENMLYPMCDRALGGDAALLQRVTDELAQA